MNYRKPTIPLLLLALTLLSSFLVYASDREDQNPIVTGADVTRGSLAGGTIIKYRGVAFSSVDASQNQVFFCNYQTMCDTVTFETSTTLVTCKTRPYYEYVTCDTWINVDGQQTAGAPSFTYSQSSTPMLAHIESPAITPSGLAELNLMPLVSDAAQISIKIGNETTALVLGDDEGEIPTSSINGWAYQDFSFDTGDNNNLVPGHYNVTVHVKPHGNALPYSRNWFFTPEGRLAQVTVLPNISALSNQQGSPQGAIVTVTGSGFPADPSKITAKLGTQSAQVLSSSFDKVTVRLPASNGEVGPFETHAGLKVYQWDNSNGAHTIQSLRDAFNANPSAVIATAVSSKNFGTSEAPKNTGDRYIRRAAGWFESPVNGNIKFYVSGDDRVALYFNPTADNTTPQSTPVAQVLTSTGYRDYYVDPANQISQPIGPLAKGSKYWIEIWHLEYTGSDHFSVGFGFDDGVSSRTRPTNLATIFDINVTAAQIYDQHTVTLTVTESDKAANATWVLRYIGVDSYGVNQTQQTSPVYWNATDNEVAVLFMTALGTGVTVTHTLSLSDGSPAPDFESAEVIVYTATLTGRKGRDYTVITSSLVTNPVIVQTVFATPKLSGSFTISLLGKNVDINICDDSWTVASKFVTVPSITDPVVSSQTGGCAETGRTWRFALDGALPKDVPAPVLVSLNISGGATPPPSVAINTIQSGSLTEQLWATIPAYLLQASSDQLELSLQVGNFRALATGSAYFSYLAASSVPQISAVTRSGSTITVVLDNVQVAGFSSSSIDLISYSGYPASISSISATGTQDQYEITAILATNGDSSPIIVAGNSYPEISITGIGFAVPSGSLTLADSNVLPAVSSISPTSGSIAGFTEVTISGNYFGYSLANSFGTTVTIGGAPCTITSLSNTQIECTTGASVDGSPLRITVNSMTKEFPGLFTYTSAGAATVTGSSPASANPTLKTTLQIAGDFGASPVVADYKVYLDATDSNGAVTQYGAYQCYTTSVSSTLLECVLAGGIASPTLYNVRVVVAGFGAAIPNPSYPTFQFQVAVHSITPSSGSYAGGTVLQITGLNFPTEVTQNQVTVGPYLVRCQVLSATATLITCLTGPADSDYQTDVAQPVYVLSRIQDEATCIPASACSFAYSNSRTPSITSISTVTGVAGDTVTISGTNLDADSSESVVVTVGGVSATVTASSATSVSFTVPGQLISGGYYLIQVQVGNKGYASFSSTSLSQFQVTGRQILDVNPKTLSQGGGVLTITGGGFDSSADTVTVNGVSARIISASASELKVVVPPTTSASLVPVVSFSGGSIQTPSSIVISTSTSVTPVISAVSVDGSGLIVSNSAAFSISFTGTNLNLEAPIVILTDKSNSASTFTSTLSTTPGATSFSAPFSNVVVGVYSVTVNYPNNGYAKITVTSDVTVTWVTPTASPAQVVSGIAGGAEITISGNGFPDSSLVDAIDFTVCGIEAEVVSSSASQIVIRAPAYLTPLSLQSYKLAEVSEIFGSPISDSGSTSASSIFDGVFSTYYSSTASSCYIGVDFGVNSLGLLSKIKYFPKVDSDVPKYYGTVLQGSNDQLSWNSIPVKVTDSTGVSTTNDFVIGYEIHDGYNQIVFDDSMLPSYRYYRFLGNGTANKCAFAEIQFYGIVVSNQNPSTLTSNNCDGVLTINGKTQTFPNLVNYKSSITPVVTNVSPAFASANGGDQITVTGTGFPTGQVDSTSITIDGTICDVQSVTSTSAVCITRQAPPRHLRPISLDSSFKVWFNTAGAAGYAAGWQDLYFMITERWSQASTWGGLPAPGIGDSVYVPPGLSLLVDVNVNVYAVIVEGGAVIFSDESDLTFDAHYVFIRQGIFRAGTPERPYQSKLTITMHGSRYDPQLPTFGNKNIALREGIIDLNGVPRTPTWTFLEKSVSSGDTTITLLRTVDWKVGEEIVLASSTLEHANSETAVILSVANVTGSAGGLVTRLTLTTGLKYNHYSNVLSYPKADGTLESITMRTEVGLLTRNIIFQGDDESPNTEYGAHLMIHSPGDESSIGRISYIRVRQAGQAYIMGRYAIHFHMIGAVSKSFVKGNAIHHTYNRATTIHGVHYLTVEDNVVYWCKGHNIFIEDGIETHNLIKNNLVISTLRSWSLLNTDQTPASFWITNPNNMWIGNHAAGSDRYGFWFDLHPHPIGPSYTPLVCPPGERLGAFRDNVAHSNGRYGIRIFHSHTPTVDPCSEISETNPSVPAVYQNFTGWKNKRAAVMGEVLGEVTFSNIKTADNLQSGVELSVGGAHGIMKLKVENVLLVGMTENAADNGVNKNDSVTYNYYWDKPTRGIVTTRFDGMLISNVRFHSWPPGTAAFQDCSHCESAPATDSGARTAFIEKVYWSPTFTGRKIQYNIPLRGIFRDLDGTLTGKVGWATAYFPHNDVPECRRDEDNYNGLICDDSVQVRRVVFYNYAPDLFDGVPMYIFNCNNKSQGAILDHAQCNTYQNENYDFHASASVVNWRQKQNPTQSWAVGFVTGYTYNPYWGPYGIDFDQMSFQNTGVYKPTDKTITLALNHSNYRETFDFTSGGLNLSNRTTAWTTTPGSCNYGDWQHDWENKRLFVCISGNQIHSALDPATNATVSYNVTHQPFVIQAVKCRVNCPLSFQNQTREGFIRNWSVDTDWIETTVNGSSRRLLSTTVDPNASEVIIPPSWRMRVDVPRIPQTPGTSFKRLEIRGDLVIDEVSATKNGFIEIFAETIWIRGNFFVGSNIYNLTDNKPLQEIQPYNGKLRIYLTGSRNADGLTFSGDTNPGNKVLASTGLTHIVGQPKGLYTTKLAAPAKAGDTSIVVMGDASSWKAGDMLGVSPTAKNVSEYEYVIVDSTTYDPDSDQTTINLNLAGPTYASYDHVAGQALQYDHYGCTSDEQAPGIGTGSFDLRADIAILSRDIVITANELDNGTAAIDGWGASIYSSEVYFLDNVTGTFVAERGALKLDGIQCDFCGQADTYQAAIHLEAFEPNPDRPAGYMKNSVISGSNGVGIAIKGASDFVFDNNVIFDVSRYGLVFLSAATNIVFSNNLIVGVKFRNTTADAEMFTDLSACVYAEYELLGASSFINNVAVGCAFHGIIALGAECGKSWVYQNNVARISDYPFFIKAPNGNCTYASGMVAYGGDKAGVVFVYNSLYVIVDNVITVDSNIAIAINQGIGQSVGQVYADKIFIGGAYYPYSQCSAEVASKGLRYGGCSNKLGFLLGFGGEEGKSLPPTPPKLPWYGIKATGGWGAVHRWSNVQVKWFEDNAEYGCSNNFVFQSNADASDNSAVTILSNFTASNVSMQRIAKFTPPQADWIGIDNCGNWPCTGIKNILVKDLDGSLTGTPSAIIPQNDGVIDSTCRQQGELSYTCSSVDWAVLTFQSLDLDKEERIFSPINITNSEGFTNDLNTMMDHCWDGFYTCLKRLSRFPSLVRTGRTYHINPQGSLPDKLQFQMFGATTDSDWVLSSLQYTQGTAVIVLDSQGNPIKPKILGPYENTSFDGLGCGAYTYQPNTATVTFKVDGSSDCTAFVAISSSVYASIRYPMTVAEFYSVDGPTQFIDNIAAVLQIPLYKIRVVSINQPGSNSTSGNRRLLTNARVLENSQYTEVLVLIDLPDSQQVANSPTAPETAQSYITALTIALGNGLLAIGGNNPSSASFQIQLIGVPTYSPSSSGLATSSVIAMAVVIPVLVVTLVLVIFIRVKKAKARSKSKVTNLAPKPASTETLDPKTKGETQDNVSLHDVSSVRHLDQSGSQSSVSPVQQTGRIFVFESKVIEDRILVDNYGITPDFMSKITLVPTAKHELTIFQPVVVKRKIERPEINPITNEKEKSHQ